MTSTDVAEREVIELVLPRYRDEGYEVYVHPSPSLLPAFMKSYRPDAIAIKSGKKVAIKVIRGGEREPMAPGAGHSLFSGQNEWELQLVYAPLLGSSVELGVASRDDIEAAIRDVENLQSTGQWMPAILMAYATFEAIGRALLPDQFRRPQSPVRLIEVLASEGLVTPDEAQLVRQVISVRNAVAHGGFVPVDSTLVARFTDLLSTLADLLPGVKRNI
ncbi:hypothetical protein LOC51_24400 [Rubrivivax sp. JA1024]|nr:hypothetical protein [Rubrivivax sp. JA1024]